MLRNLAIYRHATTLTRVLALPAANDRIWAVVNKIPTVKAIQLYVYLQTSSLLLPLKDEPSCCPDPVADTYTLR